MIKGQRSILDSLPIRGDERVLDVGVGAGDAREYFISKGCNVTSTTSKGIKDKPSVFIKDLEPDKEKQIIPTGMYSLPFSDGMFDVVWCSHVLEHLLDVKTALKELRRVLKVDGWFFVSVPPYYPTFSPGHYNLWDMARLIYVLGVSGFDTKNGHYAEIGYNLVACVKRSEEVLGEMEGSLRRNYKRIFPCKIVKGKRMKSCNIRWPAKRQ